MNKTKSLQLLIEQLNSKKTVPAMTLVRQDPELAAALSKMVKGVEPVRAFDANNTNSMYALDQSKLTQISTMTQERVNDSENMMQLFPDIEMGAQIMVSSVLSPKDMVNTDLIYKVSESIFPSEMTMQLLEMVENWCNQEYDLKKISPSILRDVMFATGSHIRAIIPESSVDDLINNNSPVGMEALNDLLTDNNQIQSLGFLGDSHIAVDTPRQNVVPGFESFKQFQRLPYMEYDTTIRVGTENTVDGKKAYEDFSSLSKVEVIDNYNLLKLPQAIEKNNQAKATALLNRHSYASLALEATAVQHRKIASTRELEALLYKGRQSGTKVLVSVKTQENSSRQSVGKPLVMQLPSESVIPVHVPGNPKHHICYFVLVDESGYPVTKSTSNHLMQNAQAQLNNQSSSMASFLLEKAKRNLMQSDMRNLTMDQASKIYSDIVENDLMERLKNGIYGNRLEIGKNEEIYRIMLARTLSNQFTRLLHIPGELVTYFALKYYDNGIGKSFLDDLKVITSIRAILLFAKVMALTKNSIALTHVNMTIDPRDPDPQKTIEESIHEIIKMRQQYFPLGINSPSDLMDWVQRAGFEFTFEGHPGIPNTKFDFETKQMQHTVPDDNLDELLRKQTFMHMGLNPETVDNGFTGDFATTIVSNNVLLSKRVTQIQDDFKPQISDYVRKLTKNDNQIQEALLEVIKNNRAVIEKALSDEEKEILNNNSDLFNRYALERFIETIEVDFPKPDLTSVENQVTAYDKYIESLDKGLDAIMSSDFITPSTAGQIANHINTIRAAIKGYYSRKWMSENGFLTELNDLTAKDEEGKPSMNVHDVMKNHIEGLTASSVAFIKALQPIKNASDKDTNAMNLEDDGSSSSSSEPTPEGGDGGDGFDTGMGLDDFGLGSGATGEESEPETTEDKSGETTESPSGNSTEEQPKE